MVTDCSNCNGMGFVMGGTELINGVVQPTEEECMVCEGSGLVKHETAYEKHKKRHNQ